MKYSTFQPCHSHTRAAHHILYDIWPKKAHGGNNLVIGQYVKIAKKYLLENPVYFAVQTRKKKTNFSTRI